MRNSQGKRQLTSCSGRCQRGSDCAPQDPVVTCHAGRLEDKSANVRKAALQLLATLLLNNPFGPHLPADKFTVTLEEHKQKLKVGISDTTLDAHWLFHTSCFGPHLPAENFTHPGGAQAGAQGGKPRFKEVRLVVSQLTLHPTECVDAPVKWVY